METQKHHIILSGPLPKLEKLLLERGDVEVTQVDDDLNLMIALGNDVYDCDMLIVSSAYGNSVYGLTCPVGEHKTCPVWMAADPPDEIVMREINLQLDELPARKKAARERAITIGPPKHEILILADTPQRRSDLTGWMRDIFAEWGITLPPLNVPEDVKGYLRGLRELRHPDAPPELVVIAVAGVDSLNTADEIREMYPKTGLIWSCDLNFALQAFRHHADYFFFLNEASREKLETGLDQWQFRTTHKERGNKS